MTDDTKIIDLFWARDERAIGETYVQKKDRLQKKKTWLRVGAVAASLLLTVGTIGATRLLRRVPTWDTAHYSAEEIAELFSAELDADVATNAYTKVYVPDEKYLYRNPVPQGDTLGVYEYTDTTKALNKAELQRFTDTILPTLSSSLGVPTPAYTVEEDKYDEKSLFAYAESGDYTVDVFQNGRYNLFSLYKLKGDRKIVLGGETVQIDQRCSDEEILASVASIRDKLFEIFHVSFSDAKVQRYYDYYSTYGATAVSVCFFDGNAHDLNGFREGPVSDYICISFDNAENYSGDIVSSGVLHVCSICYLEYRVEENVTLSANAKKISLHDAETLLYNGYVFGGHSCPLCMKEQEKVSFRGYDFVGLEYVFGRDAAGNETVGIPFYAFYKKIGTSQNGNAIYAKTYVAAIKVSGYEEYFESQTKSHPTTE